MLYPKNTNLLCLCAWSQEFSWHLEHFCIYLMIYFEVIPQFLNTMLTYLDTYTYIEKMIYANFCPWILTPDHKKYCLEFPIVILRYFIKAFCIIAHFILMNFGSGIFSLYLLAYLSVLSYTANKRNKQAFHKRSFLWYTNYIILFYLYYHFMLNLVPGKLFDIKVWSRKMDFIKIKSIWLQN